MKPSSLMTSLGRALVPMALTFAAGSMCAQTTPTLSGDTLIKAGTLKQVTGEVWIRRDIAPRQAAVPGTALVPADRLETGPKGSASVVMRDGTTLTLGPDSAMRLDQFAFDATTQQGNFLLDLLQGSVRVVTGLLAKVNPDVFKVRTPTSVVGVRGTDFIVDAEPAR